MANEYLQRTPTSTGNRKVFTISVWAKLNNNSNNNVLCDTNTNGANFLSIRIGTSGVQSVLVYQIDGATDYSRYWNLAERDFSAWSHHLFVFNSPAVDAGDRLSYYINGIKITNYSDTYGTFPQNFDFKIDTTRSFDIFRNLDTGGYGQGELYDYFFIDGQALTPDVFGFYKVGKGYVSAGSTQATDFRPGQWVPKTPRVIKTAINNSGGFGVNGFYLPMNDSNNFGADFHCEPNSIIKLQENLPQPRCRIDGVGDYTGALRDDPFKQYLVLALPFVSGGLQSGFGDYSAAIKGSGSAKTVTVNGSLATSNTVSLYYGSSAFLNNGGASGSQFLNTSHSDYALGLQNFTLECWIYPTSLYNYWSLLSTRPNDYSYADAYYIGTDGSGSLAFYSNGYDARSANNIIITNQWSHIAAVRIGSTLTLYLNGVAVAVNTNYTKNLTRSDLTIGRLQNLGTNLESATGYIQDLRIYKGVAKYKGGFDVPRPYTPVGIATWRAVPDSPANNFATLNAIDKTTGGTLSDGNLKFVGGAGNHGAPGTIGFSTGKYYTEMYINDAPATNSYFGIIDTRSGGATFAFKNLYLYQYNTGNKYGGEEETFSQTSYGNSVTTGDIISMAVDMVNKKIFFAKNGVWQNSSDPVSGTNSAFTVVTTNESFYIPWSNSNAAHTRTTNFGQNPSFSGNTTAGTYTDSNSKGLFKYQPPSGFLALCEDNLPTPAISDPGKHFKTVLWTGDGNSGRSISGVGFQPDLVWIKDRSSTAYNYLFDSVRGGNAYLWSNDTGAEGSIYQKLSFNANGFSLINGTDGSYPSEGNRNGNNIVAWCWKAGAGTTSTNTNGSITSVVSVNQDAGFSIVSYTGTGANATVGHGLGKVPKFMIIKNRSAVDGWMNYHSSIGPTGFLQLNTTSATSTLSTVFNNTSPTSSVFSVGTISNTNGSGVNLIAYCWAEIEGFSKFGSYTGNGSTDGPFVYCGFRPAWVMIKRTDSTGDWYLFDSSRNSSNPVSLGLLSNTTQIDGDYTGWGDFLSNGFKIRRTDGAWNASGGTYIFVAFAESPFQTANAK